jgi:predicted chitinase
MAKVDRKYFFENYKKYFGKLNQNQVDNINLLIDEYEIDEGIDRLSQFAYILATIYHECAATWKPVAEYGKGKGRPYGKVDPQTGQVYYGRGWVQLTWKYNYQKAADELGIDCVNNPELVMEVDNATKICFAGMKEGWFTGKKLADYFSDTKTDWVGARKIINGTDRANLIGNYGKKFYECLQYEDDTPEPSGDEVLADANLGQAEAIDPITVVSSDGITIQTTPSFII